jgi:hypothetical protein
MINALFRGPLDWFAGLIELVLVIAAILLVGLVVGMTGFWILGRFVRKLAGPQDELDSDEDELDEDELDKDVFGQAVSIRRDDEDSPPSEARSHFD